ncbi:MAG: DNA polymerase III subunit delta' [Gemmataceae bacterium]|nr:DNA polymerase III subunit delta' [Gemmataceae bacterium]MCI0741284.1 DNA polymerase III subunit delta' [Gemmataceae bacterium]
MSWSAIQGHDGLVETFQRVVERGRLAHAYLFVGPEGVGKCLFAKELAKALLCEQSSKQRLVACDACAACALVEAGTHPDFYTLEKPEDANEIPIELMRDLCSRFSLKAARGGSKIAVLDGADFLNEASANCFLKTLEEPPPRSVFILLCTNSEIQFPTIRSRCQMVRFAPLAKDTLDRLLSDKGIEAGLRRNLLHLAHGSPGQALALADPALWDFHKKLLEGLTRPKIDTIGLAKAFAEFAEDAGKEAALHRRRAALVLRLLIEGLTDALELSVEPKGSPATRGESLEDRERTILQALTGRADPDKILAVIERCLEAEVHIDRYVQVALVVEALLDAIGQLLEGSQVTM